MVKKKKAANGVRTNVRKKPNRLEKVKSKKVMNGKKKTRLAKKIFKREEKRELPRSFQELLEERIASNKITFVNTPAIQDILYNATPTLRQIAYNSGFSFGKALYEKSDKSIGKLVDVLQAAGFKNILYYPFEDKAIIRVKPESSYDIGKEVHIFESGIIAGYMSAASGKIIYVNERRCTFSGADVCEFVAEPMASVKIEEDYDGNVVKNLAQVLSKSDSKLSQEYMLFSLLPLMKEPVKSEISKLFYAAGSFLGKSNPSIDKIAEKFGVIARKRGNGILLSYAPTNSMKGFVDLSTAFFAGLAKSVYNKGVKIKESLSGNAYKVYIKPQA